MALFDSGVSPKEIVVGVVSAIGARKVRVVINGTKEIYAKCEPDILKKISTGYSVVIGYLEKDTEAYVMGASIDILGSKEQAIITI